jgi:hypothetical protein
MALHIISTGEYSDWTIWAVFKERDDRKFSADVAAFNSLKEDTVESRRGLVDFLRRLNYTEYNWDDTNQPYDGDTYETRLLLPPSTI